MKQDSVRWEQDNIIVYAEHDKREKTAKKKRLIRTGTKIHFPRAVTHAILSSSRPILH